MHHPVKISGFQTKVGLTPNLMLDQQTPCFNYFSLNLTKLYRTYALIGLRESLIVDKINAFLLFWKKIKNLLS